MHLTSRIIWSSLQVHPSSWTPSRLDVDVMLCSYTFNSDGDSGIAAHPKGVSSVHITPPPSICSFPLEMFKLNLASSAAVCVHWYSQAGRRYHWGLRGRAGHGPIRLLFEQQHNFCLEWAQFGPWRHKSELPLNFIVDLIYCKAVFKRDHSIMMFVWSLGSSE